MKAGAKFHQMSKATGVSDEESNGRKRWPGQCESEMDLGKLFLSVSPEDSVSLEAVLQPDKEPGKMGLLLKKVRTMDGSGQWSGKELSRIEWAWGGLPEAWQEKKAAQGQRQSCLRLEENFCVLKELEDCVWPPRVGWPTSYSTPGTPNTPLGWPVCCLTFILGDLCAQGFPEAPKAFSTSLPCTKSSQHSSWL